MSNIPNFEHAGTTYVVERTNPGEVLTVVYMLRGPRGASYGLIPNDKHPHYFFAVNTRNLRSKTPFKGRWFTTKDDGSLVLV